MEENKKQIKNLSAFPIQDDAGICQDGQEGMNLRDYFAAKAMQGLLISPDKYSEVKDDESCAEHAYKIADAMLKERNKPLT